MPTEEQTINTFKNLTDELVRKYYLPTIYDLALSRRRAELVNKIPRNSEDVEGLQVYLTYLTEIPWAWRAMSEMGYTSTGAKYHATEGWAHLGCHVSNAIVSLTELETTKQGRWVNIMDKNIRWLGDTFPYYMRGLLWSSKDSKHAIGAVGSKSGLTITLDTAALWYSQTEDVAKLFEPGMWIQGYSGDAKVGDPVKVEHVDKKAGTIQIDHDPGLSSGDLFTFSDIGGLDQPYEENVPGIYDVIDDDNVFQGIDRATASDKFQPVIQDATGKSLNYELLNDFFHDCYNPDVAHTSREIVQKYWRNEIAAGVRYTPGGLYQTGMGEGIQVDKTFLQVDDDVPVHDIVVPDNENWRIADRGAIQNLFGKGWQQIPNRPILSYDVVYWFTLIAEDTRHFGRMHSVTE